MEQIINDEYNTISSFVDGSFEHAGLRSRKIGVPNNIVVVGAGGTASWFAPKMTKILNDALYKGLVHSGGMSHINVCFIDGDEVEEKNLIRQNFISHDITKNKAEVVHGRYGKQIDPSINCGFIDKYLSNKKYHKIKTDVSSRFVDVSEIGLFSNIGRKEILFINLIDNAVTRKMIHLTATDCRTGIVIDVANNEYNGQLTTSVYHSREVRKDTPVDLYKSWFYNELPEQLDENDDVSVFSCADADAESSDQLFNANDMAATVLGNYFNDWLVTGKLSYGRVDFVTGSNMSIINSNRLYDGKFVGIFTGHLSLHEAGAPVSAEGYEQIINARDQFRGSDYNYHDLHQALNNTAIYNDYLQRIKDSM
jgi:hypothetical protein